MEFFSQIGARICKDRDSEKRSVFCTSLTDGKRSDRHAGGHLSDREQRIEAFQGFAFNWDTEHRYNRLRRTHSRQMGRTAGTGDDDLDTATLGGLSKFKQQIGRSMSRNDLCLVCHAELGQRLRSDLHRRPIGPAAHDYRQ